MLLRIHAHFLKVLFLVGVCMFPYTTTYAVTGNNITAASCSQADVQSAINQAIDGDVVMVPAGNCVWTTTIGYSPSVAITKAITLQGAGINKTIVDDGTGTRAAESVLSVGSGARLTGFTFIDSRSVADAGSAVAADGTNWRVDHNTFDPKRWVRGIIAHGVGLIDHNVFINTSHGVDAMGPGSGDASWSSPSTLGTANDIFIEDNTFDYPAMNDGAMDAYGGANYVFRYNTVIGTNMGHHGFDSGGYRAPRNFEIYNNTFTNTGSHIFTAMNFRGGTGVIFNNTISAAGGSYDNFAIIRNYRSDDSYVTTWGTCNGLNPYDGNTPGGEGYPCRDQIGRGTNQISDPLYSWNNTFKGNNAPVFTVAGFHDATRAQTYHILVNRDFYNNVPKPGYTPYPYPHPLQGTGNSSPTPTPTSDTTAPTVPANLTATVISSSQINLSWSPSTDNIAVMGYRLYRGGTQIAASSVYSYADTNLTPSTAYTYTVTAYDAAGNTSPSSNNVSAATLVTDQAPATPPVVVSTPTPSTPPLITRTLYRGMKGTQVSLLQSLLMSKGYLTSSSLTGYYGPLTTAAVQRFQCDRRIVCSGTPVTTGYGMVGKKTRAGLNTQ